MRVAIPTTAIVDMLEPGKWLVTVYGGDLTKFYTILKPTDDLAAREGLRRFADETETP